LAEQLTEAEEPGRQAQVDDYHQLAALNEVSQRILGIRTERQLHEVAPRLLAESLDFRVAILNVEEQGRLILRGFHVLDSTAEQRQKFMHSVRTEDHAPPPDIRRCFDTGKTIISNSEGWPNAFGWPKAILLTPLRIDGKSAGVFIACIASDRRDLADHDVQRFEAFANMISLALANIRAYAHLEKRVADRTRELHDAQARLVQSEKMAALGTLVAGVCHDLNTPLGAITSAHATLATATDKLVDAVGADVANDRRVSRCVKAIRSAGFAVGAGSERVDDIVCRLRSFARLDQSDRQAIDVHDALEDALAMSRHVMKNRNVACNFTDAPKLTCDPRLLNQLFHNLLSNAVEATHEDGHITLSTSVADDTLRILFEDDGPGMSEEALSRMFDPGFTTKGVGVGSGLGLSICFEIVREHGGTIEVANRPDRGARITVLLPLTG
jgi:signal transduction histidine kinase